jgi:acyl-CoA-binding protein
MVKKAGTKKASQAATKKAAKKTSKASATKQASPRPVVTKVTKKAPAKKSQATAAAKKATAKKPVKKKAVKGQKPSRPVVTKKSSSRKTKDDEECFLTTACVSYYSLPDDGYELSTLRSFRDKHMLKTAKGKQLVKNYYSVAPRIVSMINKDKERKGVYQYVYHSIQKACSEIELKKYKVAQQTYIALVNHLSKKYRIDS